MLRQELWTRDRFERWLRTRAGAEAVRIDHPYDVRPCTCGDINCHGWRLNLREDR
jgi:hypothetical protein